MRRREEKREGSVRPEKKRKEGVFTGEESRDTGGAGSSNVAGNGGKEGDVAENVEDLLWEAISEERDMK
eukprot:4384791-Karenia_brevis.AAC.1